MFVECLLWAGRQFLNGGRRSCPESGRLWNGQVKSTVFALVLAWRCLHDTRRHASIAGVFVAERPTKDAAGWMAAWASFDQRARLGNGGEGRGG